MPDPFDITDVPTGDEIDIPVDPPMIEATVHMMGGTIDAGMVRLPNDVAPIPAVALQFGDVDLGRWRLVRFDAKARHSGTRYVMTLQRVADQ